MKICSKCKNKKPAAEFSKWKASKDGLCPQCKECRRLYAKSYYQDNKERLAIKAKSYHAKNPHINRKASIRYKYGISSEEYDAIVSRGCFLCGKQKAEGRICLDHDHNTLKIRGALCHGCNTLLGHAQENPEILRKAADYIETHRNSS